MRTIKTIMLTSATLVIMGTASAFAAESCCAGSPKTPAATTATVKTDVKTVQKTCPVMGEVIDKTFFVDYKGQRIFFCCGMCPATFKANPEKYMSILATKGEVAISIPTK